MRQEQWVTDLSTFIKSHGEPGKNELFPEKASADELAAGFLEGAIPNPMGQYAFEPTHIRAVFRPLGAGRVAVKAADPTGRVAYAIWSDEGRPVAEPLPSVVEVTRRYPRM